MTNTEMQNEALERARSGASLTNYPAIFSGFMAKGIAESEIDPRVNVLTFNAWKALGRVVKRGEHGVKVITFVPIKDKESGEVTGKRPWTSTVFHISQTKEIGASDNSESKADNTQKTAESQGFAVSGFINSAPRESGNTDRWIEG